MVSWRVQHVRVWVAAVQHARWRLMACTAKSSTYFSSALSWQASYYRCGFLAWISDWRAKSTAPHTRGLAFLYVQLAPHESGSFAWSFDRVSASKTQVMVVDDGAGVLSGLAELRQAQDAALQLPLVGMASAVDLGDPLRTRAHPQQLPPPPRSPSQSFLESYYPRNKRELARRLVLEADRLVYGSSVSVQVWVRAHNQGPRKQAG